MEILSSSSLGARKQARNVLGSSDCALAGQPCGGSAQENEAAEMTHVPPQDAPRCDGAVFESGRDPCVCNCLGTGYGVCAHGVVGGLQRGYCGTGLSLLHRPCHAVSLVHRSEIFVFQTYSRMARVTWSSNGHRLLDATVTWSHATLSPERVLRPCMTSRANLWASRLLSIGGAELARDSAREAARAISTEQPLSSTFFSRSRSSWRPKLRSGMAGLWAANRSERREAML